MGKGKHSGDPNDFGDTSSYTYRKYTSDNNNDNEEEKSYDYERDSEDLAKKRADEFFNRI